MRRVWLGRNLSDQGSWLGAGGLGLEGSPALKARLSSRGSCLTTASVLSMMINGHKMPRRQQLPHSVESAVIYGIEALREQLSELGETSEK